jgi:glycerol kinase
VKKYILAFDEGTTSNRAIVVDHEGNIIGESTKEFTQIYPQPGWVEHNGEEIIATQFEVARKAIEKANIKPEEIIALGITNQRETAIVWDRKTGKPIYHAIVWQSRQTAEIIESWGAAGYNDEIRAKTGLVPDAYFSASKVTWILDHVEGAREKAEKGELAFGNIDTWLIWNLTKGKSHVTDYSNASRSMMFNINELKWDEELLRKYRVPKSMLGKVLPSSAEFGVVDKSIFGAEIPILGDLGDQQAGLFGQACFKDGMTKQTYGTAGVFTMNCGNKPLFANGLTTSCAWGLNGDVKYEVEGVSFISGATIQWVRDNLRLIRGAADTEWYGSMAADTGGVYLVPAFVGLCAPFWDMYARGMIMGLTRGTSPNQIIRAAVESMAYQVKDIIDAVLADGRIKIPELRLDGGAVKNNLLCQFQADILGMEVVRPTTPEMTALGAAHMAGLTCGFWKDLDEIASHWKVDKVFKPNMTAKRRKVLYGGWVEAVKLTRGWTTKIDAIQAEADAEEAKPELVGAK